MIKKIILLYFLFIQCALAQTVTFDEGTWFKIKVNKSGVYTLDKAYFKKNKINISDFNTVKIFSGNIAQLPQENTSSALEGLVELPVNYDEKNAQIKFWAEGKAITYIDSEDKFAHSLHNYSADNFYFIKIDNQVSKKINAFTQISNLNKAETELEVFEYEEKELKNPLNTGRQWLGDFFYNSYSFKPSIKTPNSDIQFSLKIMGIGRTEQILDIKNNNVSVAKYALPKSSYNSGDAFDRYNRYSTFSSINVGLNDKIDLQLSLATANSANAGAYIDYLEYSYKTNIKLYKNQQSLYWFRNQNNLNESSFTVSDINANTQIWEVSNYYDPVLLNMDAKGTFGRSLFKKPMKIIVLDNGSAIYPETITALNNKNILSSAVPELLIVYPPKFKSIADKITNYKNTKRKIKTLAVSTTDIYDTFSSGKVDPSAIRNLCKYFWKKDSKTFQYLLLLGDASFDYKNNNKLDFVNIDNLVPTYEAADSFEPIYSYSSDDYFGFLEDQEGSWPEGKLINSNWISDNSNDHSLDISVGRWPIKSLLEGENILNKVIKYESQIQDSWQSKISLVADNRDYNIHSDNSENLAKIITNANAGIEINKIYLDNYDIQKDKILSPDATKSLTETINQGSFLINYVGHGSEDGWAQEKILTTGDILAWKNKKLPILFTATCQFGKFDNPSIVSGAELALLQPNAGAIALLTTTRPVYASTNEKINAAFFKNLKTSKTIGELFKITKNQSIQGELNRNFTLLGDPTMPLPVWDSAVTLNKINDLDPLNIQISSYQRIRLNGISNKVKNGKMLLEIFDNPDQNSSKGSYNDSPSFDFDTQSKLALSSLVNIKNGTWDVDLNLPAFKKSDTQTGLMRFLAISDDSTVFSTGFNNDFKINSSFQTLQDNSAPIINAKVNKLTNLEISAEDNIGLNSKIVDGFSANYILIDNEQKIFFDNTFQYSNGAKNIFGKINLGFLSAGKHNIKIFIFDINNNKAEKSLDIEISKPDFKILNSLNYPNPFFDYTNLVFYHNRASDHIYATLSIYDMQGKELYKTENDCVNCNEKINFGLDFEGKKIQASQLIFVLKLKSLTENAETKTSGRLMFWK